jgi:hypothetical protein
LKQTGRNSDFSSEYPVSNFEITDTFILKEK